MKHHLVVVHEFGNFVKGQKITDQDEVAAVLASHNHTHVVKVAAPAEDEEPSPPALPQ
jgi:hypothetical protein